MNITLFGLLAVIGFFISGLLLWRGATDNNIPSDQAFDVYIASSIWALIAARAASIVLHFDRFGWNLLRWLSLFYLPGLEPTVGLAVGVAMVLVGIVRRGWDRWSTMDLYAPAVLSWQSLLILTFSPLVGIWWLCVAGFLLYTGREYRLWEWYRGRRGEARPGLVTAFWLVGTGGGYLLLALQSVRVLFSIVVGVPLILVGLMLIYRRSARAAKIDVRSVLLRIRTRRRPGRQPESTKS